MTTAIRANTGRTLALSAAIAAVFAAAAEAAETDELARRILSAASRPVGLVHLPRCGDGALALALAEADPRLHVHGQDANPDSVANARSSADRAGLLGRRLWIDQGDLRRLLPVGRSCDLVVLADLKAEDLAPQLAEEIRRVLHPWYGLALLGDASGGLAAEAILGWARTIDADAMLLAAEHGGTPLVVAAAAPLEGSDDWTHWWHGPDNNAVSADRAYALPETLQWAGKPFFSTRLELPIVRGGRLLVVWNGDRMDRSPGVPVLAGLDGEGPLLTAQAVGSGVRLWSRRLSPEAWLQASRSIMVADGERLLVADGSRILELDQGTGEELRRAEPRCGEIRWMAVAGGHVLLVGGPPTHAYGQRSPEAVIPFRSSGLRLLCLDRQTMNQQWRVERQAGPEAFDPRSPAVADGKVFLATEGGDAEAYAVDGGRRLWQVATGIVRRRPLQYEWDRSSRHPVTGYAVAGVYVVSATELDQGVVLSQADGRRLWEVSTPDHRQFMPLAFDGLLWMGGDGLDPTGGEVRRSLGKLETGGCSRLTASPQGILGTTGLTWDLLKNKPCDPIPAKSACGAGALVANGLAWKFPSACSNCTEWRGFIARAAAEKTAAPPPRHLAGDASRVPAESLAGWTTYRGDAGRKASSFAEVGRAGKIVWHAPPVHPAGPASEPKAVLLDAEIVPAPPVVGGSLVILAGGDGAVDALSLSSGERHWRSYTGGRIHGSPTIWKDRVFAASADGFLYAFAISDGRELWRLRVAPEAGRAMLFGQLGSRWPALGSPLVAEDRVYVSAGLLDGVDGVWAVAADAASGRLLWQQSDWSPAGAKGILSGAGQFCWDGSAVYHGGEAPLVRLRASDGACSAGYTLPGPEESRQLGPRNVQATYRCSKGQDVGSLAPGWTVFGGRRLFTDQSEEGTWRNNLTFLSHRAEGGLPLVRAIDSTCMPAWDDKEVLLNLDSREFAGFALASQEKLLGRLADQLSRDPAGMDESREPLSLIRPTRLNVDELIRWRFPIGRRTVAVGSALTADAALVLTEQDAAGQLTALDRTSGQKLWEVALPSNPIHDGMAVAADGRILVALRDGSALCLGE